MNDLVTVTEGDGLIDGDASILARRDQILSRAKEYRKFWLWWKCIERRPKMFNAEDYERIVGRPVPESFNAKQLSDKLFVEYVKARQL